MRTRAWLGVRRVCVRVRGRGVRRVCVRRVLAASVLAACVRGGRDWGGRDVYCEGQLFVNLRADLPITLEMCKACKVSYQDV